MAVPSVPRFYSWAQLTYQATRGRSGTAPGRGHQRGAKGGPRFYQGSTKGSGAETCPGGHLLASRCSMCPVFTPWGAAVQARVQRFQPGELFRPCGSIGAGPSRSRPPRQTGQPCKRPFRPALLLPMDPWRPVCQRRRLGAILGGRIGAQPCAQADTLRGRHPRPHQSTGAADPDQGGGAGGRGENRGGGSGVSICPEKLSL